LACSLSELARMLAPLGPEVWRPLPPESREQLLPHVVESIGFWDL